MAVKCAFLFVFALFLAASTSAQTGCTNENAANYDPEAIFNDGSCTVWDCIDGPYIVTFTKNDFADPTEESNQDRIAADVWITRGNQQGLFNAFDEEFHTQEVSPTGTLWKQGVYDPADDPTDGSYMVFRDHHGSNASQLPGTISTLYLQDHEEFYEVHWEAWTDNGQGGGFTYTRIFVSGAGCSQIPAVTGCTDEMADNYDIEANMNDGSCSYPGCIDPSACNFDDEATVNDGTCIYECLGCTDAGAANYDPLANVDDGSCSVWDCFPAPYSVVFMKADYADPNAPENQDRITEDVWITRGTNQGLYNIFSEDSFNDAGEEGPQNTLWKLGSYDVSDDPTDESTYQGWRLHCDFNPPSLVGAVSTLYLSDYDLYFEIHWTSWTSNNQGGGFSYQRIFIATGDCVEETANFGCTDELASNFDVEATLDDGSCLYPGCTDPTACNFDPDANDDDGSCTTVCEGCTAPEAANYDPMANVNDGSCAVWDCYPAPYFIEFEKNNNANPTLEVNQDRITADVWITRGSNQGLYNIFSETTWNEAGQQGPAGTLWKLGSYDPLDDPTDDTVYMSWEGHSDGDPPSLVGGTSTLYLIDHDLYFEIHWTSWTCCSNGGGFSYERVFIGTGDCAEIPATVGCTNPAGSNYDETADFDDGSCLIDGCVDPDACNYSDEATVDDGTCEYDCPGCTDPESANYDPFASEDDGSCESYSCFTGGSELTFTKEDNADPEEEVAQDRITDNVWLSRENDGGLYNVVTNDDTGTLWKLGAWEEGDDPANEWVDFISHNDGNFFNIAGETSSVYLVEDSLVFNVYWNSWTCCENGGGFSYTRTYVAEASIPCGSAPAIYGCTNPDAVNFDPDAEADNGTCTIIGCVDESACNYNPAANLDDGSCISSSGDIMFVCPTEINYILVDDQLSVILDYDDPVLQGVCPDGGGPYLVSGLSSGAEFAIGTTTNSFEINNEGNILSCSFDVNIELYGCMDDLACNYNENANVDDGSCTFAEDDPGLACPDDIEAQVVLDDTSVNINYGLPVVTGLCDAVVEVDSTLFLDNGLIGGSDFPVGITPVSWFFDDGVESFSCAFTVTINSYFGCTSPDADNYNSEATEDDGSCIMLDCGDSYTGPVSMTFTKENFADWNLEENQDRVTDNVWMTRKDMQGLYNIFDQTGYSGGVGGPSNTEWYLGTTGDPQLFDTWIAAAQSDPSTYCNNNSEMVLKISDADLYFDIVWHSFTGSNNGGGFSYTRTLDVNQSGCDAVVIIVGCMDEDACNYNEDATADSGSCIVPVADCSECNENNTELVIVDTDGDGVCDADEVLGCTSDTACNYDEEATEEDGNCVEPVEDCSECDGANLVIIDTDEDGICDADEIPGCTDPDCQNYDADATDDDGSCMDCANGVDELGAALSANFYLDPVSDMLTIQLSGITSKNAKLQLWNLQGKELLSRDFANSGYDITRYVDMSGEAAGMYVITVQANDKIYSYKVIKE